MKKITRFHEHLINKCSVSKTKLLCLFLVAFGFFSKAQNVNIPSAIFKSILVNNSSINTNGDSEIQVSEANAFTGVISIFNQPVSDIAGLEEFVNLSGFNCTQCQLTSADLSNNTALTELSIDNTSTTASNANNLTSIDLSNNTSLNVLRLSNNSLSSIDISNNTLLTQIYFGGNSLNTLNTNSNTNLSVVHLDNNNFTSYNVSGLANLTRIQMDSNPLQYFDLSNNSNLTFATLSSCNLFALDMANGNNQNFTGFNAMGNADLSCINIDSGFTPPSNIWFKDASASFSGSCAPLCFVDIPDPNFKAALLANTSINTNGNSEIECLEATNYNTSLSLTNAGISDLTGIESFVNINGLNVTSNNLTTLDVSQNQSLGFLQVGLNNLTALDLSQNNTISSLSIFGNQITALDVSNLSLGTLIVSSNPLTSLNLTGQTNLQFLYANDIPLTTIDFSTNTSLDLVQIMNTSITNLDLSNNTALRDFNATDSMLSSIDFTGNPNIEVVNIVRANLSSIDITGLTNLTDLFLNDNQIAAIDISTNTALDFVFVSNNALTSANMANGNNPSILAASLTGNPNLSCIQVDSGFTPNWAKDATASYSGNCAALSINDFETDTFKIYPNPTSSILNIESLQDVNQIQIYSITGKVLKTIKNSKAIDVSDLTEGMYFVQVTKQNGSVSKSKFLKK